MGRNVRRSRWRRAAVRVPAAALAAVVLAMPLATREPHVPPARELPPAPAAPYPHTGEAVAPPCPEGFEERPEVTAPDEGIHVRLDIEPAQAAAGEVPDLHIVNSGRNESRP